FRNEYSGRGSVAGDLWRAAERLCGAVSAARWPGGVNSAAFRGRRGRRRGRPGCCRGVLWALGWLRARVEDESKCRRQGLVVCRATLPLEGFCDARPGVTLAPAFFGVAACQSRTIRVYEASSCSATLRSPSRI